MKIVVMGSSGFNDEQKQRLEALGQVSYVPQVGSAEEWLQAVEGGDVICSDGSYLLENLGNLKNVFVTYPYIELGAFDTQKLAENGVTIANTRGSNRDSIAEWAMFMVVALLRKFPAAINATQDVSFERTTSLMGQKVLIVGRGNIGTKIGELCQAFGMEVNYFERGDNLYDKAAGNDVVINCLNCNSSSKNLLDADFFMGLRPGARFVSFVRPYTYDVDGMIEALKNNTLAGAAIDCDPQAPGDTQNEFYQKLLNAPNVLVTPHIAFATQQAAANGMEAVVQNIEAFVAGKPQNVLTKI